MNEEYGYNLFDEFWEQDWISWRNTLGSTLHHFQVVKFVKKTKSAFYSECMEKIL
jgi:hypothetical protein